MDMKAPNYGNWVPERMLVALAIVSVVLLASAALFAGFGIAMASWVCGALFILSGAFLAYMFICHELFAFGKGNMMAKVHEHLVSHLGWDGEGTLLDIGCGSGALTVRCLKAFPKAEIIGMDYWGVEWSYAKEQCEENAKLEGVGGRCSFEKGDAAKMEYADGSFDAAVSNFVFHEVRSAKDKRDVVREALRVVKKGGCFAFQDLFGQKSLYGNIEEFAKELKDGGIDEIHYVGGLEDKLGFPSYAKTPWMISGVGILYGRK